MNEIIAQRLANVPEVPQYVLDQIPQNSSSQNIWFFMTTIFVLTILIVITLMLIIKVSRNRKNSEIDEILRRAKIYLENGKYSEARNGYMKMKAIAEKTKRDEDVKIVIGFYKELERYINGR